MPADVIQVEYDQLSQVQQTEPFLEHVYDRRSAHFVESN